MQQRQSGLTVAKTVAKRAGNALNRKDGLEQIRFQKNNLEDKWGFARSDDAPTDLGLRETLRIILKANAHLSGGDGGGI
jgi:hypothetical protein